MKLQNIKNTLLVSLMLAISATSYSQTGFDDDVDDEAEVPVQPFTGAGILAGVAAGFYLAKRHKKINDRTIRL